MVELFANNAHGVLASGISAGATSLTLGTGEGARFPNPTGLDFFRCSIETLDGLTTEIIFVTSRSSDSFATIVRGQEGTTPAAFSAGARVRLRPTAGMLEAIADVILDEQAAFSHGVGYSGLSPNSFIGFSISNSSGGTHTYPAVSDATFRESFRRVQHVAINTSQMGYGCGSNATRHTRGSGVNTGGFDLEIRFALGSDLAGAYGFWGCDNNNSTAYSGTSPETRTTIGQIGVGFSSLSSPGGNFFIYHSSGSSGTVTAIDTGIPRTTTGVFRFRYWCAPNDSVVNVMLEDLETGVSFVAALSTNIPASTDFLYSARHIIGGVIGNTINFYGVWRFNVNQSEPII